MVSSLIPLSILAETFSSFYYTIEYNTCQKIHWGRCNPSNPHSESTPGNNMSHISLFLLLRQKTFLPCFLSKLDPFPAERVPNS